MKVKNYTVDIEHMSITHEVIFEVCISDENVVIAIQPLTAMDYWRDQDENGTSENFEDESYFFGYSETVQGLLYDELEEKLLSDGLDCCVVVEGERERLYDKDKM